MINELSAVFQREPFVFKRPALRDSHMKCMVCQLPLLDAEGQPLLGAADYARVGTSGRCPHPCCTGCLGGALLQALPGLYSCPRCSDAGQDVVQYTRWRRRGAGEELSSEVVKLASGVRRAQWVEPAVLREELREALWNAALEGWVDDVRYLLAEGANPAGRGGEFQTTPVDEAFFQGHFEIVRMLKDFGAHPSLKVLLERLIHICWPLLCTPPVAAAAA